MTVKRLLYVASVRDRSQIEASAAECFTKWPIYNWALLFNLESLGWQTRKCGLRESLSPFRLAPIISSYDPHVIYSYWGTTSLQPILAREFLLRWRGPIVHAWDDYYDEIWTANFGRGAGWVMRLIEYLVIRHSDYIFTISRHNEQRARRLGKRVWYIPNGCDIPQYDPSECSVKLDGALNLVYCGDQHRYKRTPDILEAMARVPRNVKLYLVGATYEYVKEYESENVINLGPRWGNDKWSILSQADVLVCTADQDCNAKFQEYLRMKKPILAYDGRPNLLFKNRQNAFLTKDYASAIMELYQSPDLRKRLAENAARDIPVFTWREIAEKYDSAFSEVLTLYAARSRHM